MCTYEVLLASSDPIRIGHELTGVIPVEAPDLKTFRAILTRRVRVWSRAGWRVVRWQEVGASV